MILKIDIKPLSVNEVWQGRRFKSKAYKNYEETLLWILPKNLKPISGPVEIRFKFYMKNNKMSDWDNPIKPLQDVLVKSGIITEDRYIHLGMAQKIASDRDYVEVMLLPYVDRDIFSL